MLLVDIKKFFVQVAKSISNNQAHVYLFLIRVLIWGQPRAFSNWSGPRFWPLAINSSFGETTSNLRFIFNDDIFVTFVKNTKKGTPCFGMKTAPDGFSNSGWFQKYILEAKKWIFQAALYTGGLAGGISALGWVAPSKDSFNMMAPLAMGMGLVLVAAMASPFFR